MSAFTDGLDKDVLDVLLEFGETTPLSFTRTDVSTYDSNTQTYSGPVTTYTADSVPIDYKTNEIDGSTVKVGDNRVLINRPSVEPDINDRVLFRGNTYRIMSIERYGANSVNVVFILQLRK